MYLNEKSKKNSTLSYMYFKNKGYTMHIYLHIITYEPSPVAQQ